MSHVDVISKMTLEKKCSLLSGGTVAASWDPELGEAIGAALGST